MADVQRRIELPDSGQLFGLGVFLEKKFTAHAAGRAHQRNRPVFKVRHHDVADQAVIAHQFNFGDAGAGVYDAFRIGHAQLAGQGMRHRRGLAGWLAGARHTGGLFAHDIRGGFVGSQPMEHRMPDVSGMCPFAK